MVKKKKAKARPTKSVARVKPVGEVTHFYNEIKVAIVKFKKPVSVGATLNFSGATTNFSEKIASMQYDHKPIQKAPKGKEIGIKVKKRARQGDQVFLIEE